VAYGIDEELVDGRPGDDVSFKGVASRTLRAAFGDC
jgi:hypothetical protein